MLAMGVSLAHAQSTMAVVSGTLFDEEHAVLADARITVTNHDSGIVSATTSDKTGVFLLGLPPGVYTVTIDLTGFTPRTIEDLVLTVDQKLDLTTTLRVAKVSQSVEVTPAVIESIGSVVGQTITTTRIEQLPIPERDFRTLALLLPGIMRDQSAPAATGDWAISASAQTSRNNQFIVDGLPADSVQTGRPSTRFSVDATREFIVISQGATAEFGQASGAIVSVVTRSGSNRSAGRGYYLQRLPSRPAGADLANVEQARASQRSVGGFLGGPIRPDRAFFFASLEYIATDNDSVITSPALKEFRPDESAASPDPVREPELLGRGDLQLSQSNHLMIRYHLSELSEASYSNEDRSIVAHERTTSFLRRSNEIGIVDAHVFGRRTLNELRLQAAHLTFDDSKEDRCVGCPTEDHPNLLLGHPPNWPRVVREPRYHLADTLIVARSDWGGNHTFKSGVDVNVTMSSDTFLTNASGMYKFSSDEPFDPERSDTAPTRFMQTFGQSAARLRTTTTALYFQDQWRPRPHLTLDLGIRWDHASALGISSRADDIGPRLGLAFDPWDEGRTKIRATLGRYYDSAFVQFDHNEALADQQKTIRIDNPTYVPWVPGTPYVSPLLADEGKEELDTRSVTTKRIPYTDQASVGFQHTVGRSLIVSADAVRARGHRLFLMRDQNYPLNVGQPGPRVRPISGIGKINSVESIGNSWYSGLLVSAHGKVTSRTDLSLAYTWSSSERDTEDFGFVPQDHRFPGDERGPSLADARHQFVGSVNTRLPLGLQAAAVMTARSALPYNVTTGNDDNLDLFRDTDRPFGVSRNSARGADFWQLDLRVSKRWSRGARQVEVLAEAFNLTNRQNLTDFDGVNRSGSTTFGKARSADSPRQIQLGVRIDF